MKRTVQCAFSLKFLNLHKEQLVYSSKSDTKRKRKLATDMHPFRLFTTRIFVRIQSASNAFLAPKRRQSLSTSLGKRRIDVQGTNDFGVKCKILVTLARKALEALSISMENPVMNNTLTLHAKVTTAMHISAMLTMRGC